VGALILDGEHFVTGSHQCDLNAVDFDGDWTVVQEFGKVCCFGEGHSGEASSSEIE